MTVPEGKEKRRVSQRYVKRNLGMWTGLAWYLRIVFAPLYVLGFAYHCLKGTPINLQILHEEDYEPEEPSIVKCSHCGQLESRSTSDLEGGIKGIEVRLKK